MDYYRHAFWIAFVIRQYDYSDLFRRICLVQQPKSWAGGLCMPHIVGEMPAAQERRSVPQSDIDMWGSWLWTAMPTEQYQQLIAGQLPDPYILDRVL